MKRMKSYLFGLSFLLWVWLFLARLPGSLQGAEVFLLVNGGMGFVFVFWVILRFWRRTEWWWAPLTNWFGLFVLLRIVWLAFAPMPLYGSLDKALFNILSFLLFIFFLQHFSDFPRARAWENALISLAIVIAGYEVLLAYIWLRNWWYATGLFYSWPPVGIRVLGGLLEHPNVTSGYLNLIIPIVAARLIKGSQWGRKIVWFLVAVLFLSVQYFTSSRGGWVSGLAGLGITLVLLTFPDILDGKFTQKVRAALNPTRVILGAIAVIILGVGFSNLLVGAQTTPGHGGRLDIWASAIEVWREHWLTGAGTGGFQVNYVQVIQAPPGFLAERAHSFLFQIGSEHSVVGLGLAFAILWAAGGSWLRGWRAAGQGEREMLAAYAGVGAAAVIHNTGDFLLGSYLYTTSLLLLISMVVRLDPQYQLGGISRKKITIILGVACIALTVGLVSSLPGVKQYNEGVFEGMSGNWEAAQEKICQSAHSQPRFSLYHFECGLANATRAWIEKENPDQLELAAEAYERGLAIEDFWPPHLANWGVLQWQLGYAEEAISTLDKVVERAPRNIEFAMQLGWMAEQMGREELAVKAYSQALLEDPWLGESEYFFRTALRQHTRDSMDFEAGMNLSERLTIRAYREFKAGLLEEAELHLQEAITHDFLNEDAHALLGLVLGEMGNPEYAWINIQIALLIDETPRILGWAAELAGSQGREQARIEYLKRAFDAMRTNQNKSEKYYAGVYHRYSLAYDLVPGSLEASLLPELVEGLRWLAVRLEATGESDKATQLIEWMENSGWNQSGDQ